MARLANKAAIVLGASRSGNMGQAIAKRFLDEGFPRMEQDMAWMKETVYQVAKAHRTRMLFNPDGLSIWPGIKEDP